MESLVPDEWQPLLLQKGALRGVPGSSLRLHRRTGTSREAGGAQPFGRETKHRACQDEEPLRALTCCWSETCHAALQSGGAGRGTSANPPGIDQNPPPRGWSSARAPAARGLPATAGHGVRRAASSDAMAWYSDSRMRKHRPVSVKLSSAWYEDFSAGCQEKQQHHPAAISRSAPALPGHKMATAPNAGAKRDSLERHRPALWGAPPCAPWAALGGEKRTTSSFPRNRGKAQKG